MCVIGVKKGKLASCNIARMQSIKERVKGIKQRSMKQTATGGKSRGHVMRGLMNSTKEFDLILGT